jgi:Toprim domain
VRGTQILAPGPGHSPKDRSLSVKLDPSAPGGVLIHSFAADPFPACRDHVASKLGLSHWVTRPSKNSHEATGKRRSASANERMRDRPGVSVDEGVPDKGEAERSARALAIWQSALPADDTPVETYLTSRRLRLPPTDALRFHSGLPHPSGRFWPTMVALVSSVDGKPMAIHRTFLARDGRGKAPIDPNKMMLGPCRGGAVRLATPRDLLMVGEGIETCLAAMLDTGYPAWAALSTSGLRSLDLPDDVRNVIVLADGEEAGEAAAQDCAWRWKREGRRVRIARPPRGMDFNDLLLGHAHQKDDVQ